MDPDPFENHLRGGLGVPAHLLLVHTETQSGRVLFDDERRDAARPFTAGAGHDHVDVGDTGPRDELLHPVEHIVVAVPDGLGAQRCRIRSGTGFGEAVGGDQFHRRQSGDPGLALLGGAVGIDHPGAHVVDGDEGRDHRVRDGKFFEDPHGVDPSQPAAPDVLAAVDRSHAQLGGLAQCVDREVLVLVPLQGMRRKTFGGEGGDALDDHPFVVIEGCDVHQTYFIVGMTNSAPSLIPDGQRSVIVLTLV